MRELLRGSCCSLFRTRCLARSPLSVLSRRNPLSLVDSQQVLQLLREYRSSQGAASEGKAAEAASAPNADTAPAAHKRKRKRADEESVTSPSSLCIGLNQVTRAANQGAMRDSAAEASRSKSEVGAPAHIFLACSHLLVCQARSM